MVDWLKRDQKIRRELQLYDFGGKMQHTHIEAFISRALDRLTDDQVKNVVRECIKALDPSTDLEAVEDSLPALIVCLRERLGYPLDN